jgi:RNA polymerase-interacting CarD/CdnL/TRCF family regulator
MALAPELRPALAQSHLLTCLAALVGGAGDTPAEVSRLAAKVLANLAVGDAHAHAQVCRLLRVGASATAPPDPLVGVYLGVILSAAGGRA